MNYNLIADFCLKEWKEYSDKIINTANDICDGRFLFDMPWDMERTHEPIVFDGKVDWLYKPSSDIEFTYQFNRHRFFVILAQSYRMTGDEKYFNKFRELIIDWIKSAASNNPKYKAAWRPLEAGLRAEYWTTALYIFGDKIDNELKTIIDKSLNKHKKLLLKSHTKWNCLSNWGVIQDHGLFDIGLYFNDNEVMNTARERLERECCLQIMNDGIQWEQSPMYHAEVLKSLLDVVAREQAFGLEPTKSIYDYALKMAKASAKMIKPNFHHALMGDSDDTDIRDIMTLSAYLFKSSEFKFFAYDKLDFESAWLIGDKAIEEYYAINSVKPNYLSCELTDSGNYIMRSSFEGNANYLHFISGCTGGGHGHSDKLHFDLYLNGEDVLVDAGRYTYHPTADRFLLKSPKSHNTISVNDKDYLKYPPKSDGWGHTKTSVSFKQPFVVQNDYEYVEGIHNGYEKLIGGCLVSRKIIWLKPNVYIVIDDFYGKGSNSYQSYFHFNKNGRITLDKNNAVYHGEKTDAYFYFAGEKSVNIIKENSKISYSYNSIEQNDCIKLQSKTFGRQSHFTIISDKNFEASTKNVRDITLINFKLSDDNFAVITSKKEIMTGIEIDGYLFAGRLIVYKNGKKVMHIW